MSRRKPKTVEGLNNLSVWYYYHKLFKMVSNIFVFELPEEWDEEYFIENLLLRGPLGVADTPLGIAALKCNYSGINLYNKPTEFCLLSPVLIDSKTYKIGIDGELVHIGYINREFQSLDNLILKYATLLAEVDASMQTTLINSRVAVLFEASSSTMLKEFQLIYDKVTRGEPAVFMRTSPDDEGNHALFNNVKQTFIGIELQDFKRGIINEFLTEIGINNSNTNKKERLITDEVNSNNIELESNIDYYYRNISKCFEKVNKLFNLNLKVSKRYDNGGVSDVDIG